MLRCVADIMRDVHVILIWKTCIKHARAFRACINSKCTHNSAGELYLKDLSMPDVRDLK